MRFCRPKTRQGPLSQEKEGDSQRESGGERDRTNKQKTNKRKESNAIISWQQSGRKLPCKQH